MPNNVDFFFVFYVKFMDEIQYRFAFLILSYSLTLNSTNLMCIHCEFFNRTTIQCECHGF